MEAGVSHMHGSLDIFVRWSLAADQLRSGTFEISDGRIVSVTSPGGESKVTGAHAELGGRAPVLKIQIEVSAASYGEGVTIVKWNANKESFSFLPTTLASAGVIEFPDYGVTIALDMNLVLERSEADTDVANSFYLKTLPLGRAINLENWEVRNRQLEAPTILGLSRDQRFFKIDVNSDESESLQVVASRDLSVPTVAYTLSLAMTAGGRSERELEEGCLPILHWQREQGEFFIEETAFATFADRALDQEQLEGTPFPVSHFYSVNGTFPPGQRETVDCTRSPSGEVVLFLRTRITNPTAVPLLAVQRLPRALYTYKPTNDIQVSERIAVDSQVRLDERGVAWSGDVPFSMHRLNGLAPTCLQPCLLLAPGESLTIDSLLSHRAEGLSEAVRTSGWNWDQKHAEVRNFWRTKLQASAQISLPEPHLCNFLKAGLIHLDLITLGEERAGPLLAKVGVYSAIASESLPIVEFYDSMGFHEIAGRCVEAFFDYQHSNGRINLYSYYDIETGAALFMAGRHFAYTRNLSWVRTRASSLKAAADYIVSLRQLEHPEKPGYGLVAGTCADPIEPETAFMLNAYNAAGLEALADLLKAIDDPDASLYRELSVEYRSTLRSALANSFANGPLIPTAQNRWVPTCAPSAERRGLQFMGIGGGETFSHRSHLVFDSLIGPIWAIYTGVIQPNERFADWLLEINSRQMNRSAIAETQPYYSRHPEIHLLRGEREAFLNAFYSGLTAMADAETFTFWEHLHKVSVHKTHEEGWALMQLRRMLWLEAGNELRLLSGIPEDWLDAGKAIEVKGAGSYFGSISFRVERLEEENLISIQWNPDFHTCPQTVSLHLPGTFPAWSDEPRLKIVEAGHLEILNAGEPLFAILELQPVDSSQGCSMSDESMPENVT